MVLLLYFGLLRMTGWRFPGEEMRACMLAAEAVRGE